MFSEYDLTKETRQAIEESINSDLMDVIGDVVTDRRFWICNCPDHFIHAKRERLYCPLCGAHENECADADVYMVGIFDGVHRFADDMSWLIAYNMPEYYDSLDEYDCRRFTHDKP